MEKTRVAIIGTGNIANAHMNAYKTVPEVEIVAAADIIPGKARAYLDRHGFPDVPAFDDTEEMLRQIQPDAVSVCSYNSAHKICTVQALEAGCHVLLEKPMSITLAEAQEMVRVEHRTGKILTIGFQPRFDVNSKKVKEIVQSGTLGDVYYIQTGGGRRRGIPGNTFIDREKAGVGALADIGCYALDFALNTVGYPKPLTVSAVAYDYFGKNPKYYGEAERFSVDDFSAAFVRLEGGITLDFRMSWAMHMDTTGDFIFLGKDAGLKVRQPHYELWGGAWDGPIGQITLMHDMFGRPTSTDIPLEKNDKSNLFQRKIQSFIDAVRTGGEAPIPTSQILYNQAIIDGIIRSSAAGHEVEIEL